MLPNAAVIAYRLACLAGYPFQDSAANGTKEEVASLLTELLQKKAGWLAQHFSIDIDAGKLGCGGCPPASERGGNEVNFLVVRAWGSDRGCPCLSLQCDRPLPPSLLTHNPPENGNLGSVILLDIQQPRGWLSVPTQELPCG